MRGGRLVTVALLFGVLVSAVQAGAAPQPVVGGKAAASAFAATDECGCHASLVEQWSKSMHAQALTDPLFLSKLGEANAATNGALDAFCKTCHAPAAAMAGELKKEKRSAGLGDGIGCSYCHQVTGLAGGKIANTSHMVDADGTMRAHLEDPKAPHPAARSAFHDSSEFCGACHNVDHPINGMHLEATYSEWKKSPWAKEGVTCQDCHMSGAPGRVGPVTGVAAAGGLQRENIYAMTFTGAQVALGDPVAATELLKSAAKVELDAPAVLGDGDVVTVKVTNTGAGHSLPTGLTEVREMWLEVYAETDDGAKEALGERRFVTVLQDAKGKAPVELWDATKIASDDRIPPRESVTGEYPVKLPAGAGSATVKAVLRYRSASDEFAGKAGVENPVTDMAAAESEIFASEEARLAAVREDATQGAFTDGMALAFALIGLAASFALVVLFAGRSRRRAA